MNMTQASSAQTVGIIKNQKKNPSEKKKETFDDFVGILSDSFKSEDERYKQIVK